jgi:hypothetical protein
MSVTLLVTGILLVVLPVAFNVAFALLAARFSYPDILRRPTSEILERFRAGGSSLVLLWWAFAMTAVAMVPAAVLVSASMPGAAPVIVILATTTGVLAGSVQFLGLLRWPFVVPALARAYDDGSATPESRAAIEVVFDALHRYLGVAVGEHLGYLFTGAWTVLVGVAMLQSDALPWWLGAAGIAVGAVLAICSLEFVGPFERNGWSLAGRVVPFAYIAWSVWLAAIGIGFLISALA